MFHVYWGLNESPFAGPASLAAIEHSPLHGEALARLAFLLENGSRLGLLIGPAGCGKSVVLREFVRQARRHGVAAALIPALGQTQPDLLLALAQQWNCNPADGDDAFRLWRLASERLAEFELEQTPALLVLDDVDCSADSLALVHRLVSVPEVPLTVVASASPPGISQIDSRLLGLVDLRIDLAAWTEQETRDYLKTSLTAAGRTKPTFNDSAARRLFALSGGAPRKVNQLAQLALVAGAGQKLPQIDEATILAVQEELAAAK